MGLPFHPQPKPEPRRRSKGRKKRVERKVIQSVRAQCVERDGHCRIDTPIAGDQILMKHECSERSEWAHFGAKKRAHTRGMAPEVRHTTADSLMLCQDVHRLYDASQLAIDPLSDQGCNGPLAFRLTPSGAIR